MDISPTYTAIRIGNVVDCYHTVPNRIIRDGRPQIRAHNDRIRIVQNALQRGHSILLHVS